MTKHEATPEDLSRQVLTKIKGAKISSPIPSEEILTKLFKTLFYTSLKTEEGQYIKVTITLIDPENPDPNPPENIVSDRWQYIHFENHIEFNVKNLVKLSKAADVWSSSLAVYYDNNNNAYIWGMIDQAVHYHSFLNYESDDGPEQPGIFQSTITGIGSLSVIFDYELIATLKQDTLTTNYIDVFKRGEVKGIFDKLNSVSRSEILKYVVNEFPDDSFPSDFWGKFIADLTMQSISRILLRIQGYGHGGAILITDDISSSLNIKYSITYNRLISALDSVTKHTIAYTNFSNQISEDYLAENNMPVMLYLDETISQFERTDAKNALKGAIRFIASLTCVDGLVLLDKDLHVKGFGTVIEMGELPDFIYISKNATINEKTLRKVNPNNYGTRHRSMFSYCWNHPGSIGFVVSQDGDIRAISKINDKLVMWENIKVQRYLISTKLKRPLPKTINKKG